MSIIRRKNVLGKCIKTTPSRPKTEEEQNIGINIRCLPEEEMKKTPPEKSYCLYRNPRYMTTYHNLPVFLSKAEMLSHRSQAGNGRKRAVLKKGGDKKAGVFFFLPLLFFGIRILTALLSLLCIHLDYAFIIL